MPTAIFHRGNSPNSNNKRVAIDPDHISDRTYRQDATQKNEQQSPLQAANNFIKGIIATLHKEYQHTVQKIGEDFSIKFDKISQNRNKLDSMAESNQADGTLTPSRIPKSAQIKFELRTNIQALKESAEFQALEQESKQAIIAYQNAQATILIKVKQQEIGYHQSELHKSLATGLHTLAKGHLVVNGQANVDPHQLVSTVLQRHHQTMLAPLEITPENFQNFYKSTYNLEDLPLPILTPTVDDTTPPVAPIPPQEPQALGPFPLAQIEGRRLENIDITDTIVDEQLQISNGGQPLTFEQRMDQMEPMRNALQNRIRQDLANIATFRQEQLQHPAKVRIYQQELQAFNTLQARLAAQPAVDHLDAFIHLANHIFTTSIEQYQKQAKTNARSTALKKLNKELTTTAATEQTDMVVDQEPTATPKQLEDIIAKKLAEAIKKNNKQIAKATAAKVNQSVNRALNQAQQQNSSKNRQRGQSRDGASNKKKLAPGRTGTSNNRQITKRGRSKSNTRGPRGRSRSQSQGPPNRGGPGRGRGGGRGGRGRGTARGRGNASTGGRRNRGRSRSRSSSRGRGNNSNTGRTRSSNRSRQN